MKIGIYLGDYKKPESIGDLTFETTFINELLKRNCDHEFVVYYFGKKNLFTSRENIKFVNLKYFKKPIISLSQGEIKLSKIPIRSFNYRLKKDRINIVLFMTPYLHEHIELPYYCIIRDVAHRILPHFPEFNTTSIFERREKKLNTFLNSASRIITGNDIIKNDIKTLYDVIADNISTCPMPCPAWVENTKDNELILKENKLAKDSYILYPAQYWVHKNHIRLILASQILHEQNINLKIVFTGMDRGNKAYLQEQVEEMDLNEDTVFLDYLDRNQLSTLYKNAYCMVYPSLAGADSISALEALYFNCPVLISNHSGYRSQLKNSALYFNPLDENDIVEKIKTLNDVVIKNELIQNGQILIKENSIKNYMDKFLNIMDSFYLIRRCWSLKESYKNK